MRSRNLRKEYSLIKNIKKKSAFFILLIVLGCFAAGALTTCVVIRCGLFQPRLSGGSAVSTRATTAPSKQPTAKTSDSTSATTSSTSFPEVSQPTLDNNGSAVDGAATSRTAVPTTPLSVTDKISPDVQFSSGKKGTIGSWTVENIKTNTVIMQCELLIGGRQIAQSVPMKPNQHIRSITLSDDVAAGTYKATARINYFDMTGNYISNAQYLVSLTIG